jgi:hypothetical protein
MGKKSDDIQTVRRKVKILLIDRGLDIRGAQLELSQKIGVNHNSLNMALTGYRDTPGSLKILKALQEHLCAAE